MSRIGKSPITIPKDVTVKIDKETVTVKGPRGELKYELVPGMKVSEETGVLKVHRPDDSRKFRQLHGLTRTLINNMIVGCSQGYQKVLTIIGVGYRVAKQQDALQLSLGYSHPIVVKPAKGIEFDVEGTSKILVKGIDKYLVGQTAANIRDLRPPEPYKGKGVRYEKEVVHKKLGKAGKTTK